MERSSVLTWYVVQIRGNSWVLRHNPSWKPIYTLEDYILMNNNTNRFTRSVLKRSKTLVSGFAMTRAPAHTTCIRSIGRCQGQKQWRLSIRIWQRATVLDSGLFTYVATCVFKYYEAKLWRTDLESCRNRKDRWCQTSVYQTAPRQESQISSTPPCS